MSVMDRGALKIVRTSPVEVNSIANYDISDDYTLLPTSI
jgi:hypothetical protein